MNIQKGIEKQIDMKNRIYYHFDDAMYINNFNLKNIKVYKKAC